jgi:hypothetical protein
MIRRIAKLTWTIANWSPLKTKSAKAFNALWHLGLFAAILMALWTDGVWHYHNQDTEDDQEYETELTIEEWNQIPLYLGDGQCIIVSTRQYIEC